MDSFPREFHRVFQRGVEGRHKNDDIVSSELEDAAFDYYRRQIRSSIVGETDEDIEDVAAYKLGLDRPSAKEEAWTRHLLEKGLLEATGSEEDALIREADPVVNALMVKRTPEEAASVKKWIKTLEGLENEDATSSALKRKTARPRSAVGQAVATSFSAGLGLALGTLGLRGVGLVVKAVRARLNMGKKKGGAKKSTATAPKKAQSQSAAAAATASQTSGATATASQSTAKKTETKATATRTATKKR